MAFKFNFGEVLSADEGDIWRVAVNLSNADLVSGIPVSHEINITVRVAHKHDAPTQELFDKAYNQACSILKDACAFLDTNNALDIVASNRGKAEAERAEFDRLAKEVTDMPDWPAD